MRANVLTAMAFLAAAAWSLGQITLVPRGSVWKFDASGQEKPNWNQPAFDDSAWSHGLAQLGYGDEQTVLFDDAGDAPLTIYFRRAFTLTNWPMISWATLRVLADDGVVVYLNGTEIARKNMPSGPVNLFTTAVNNVETNENSFAQFGISRYRLQPGTNVLAVEVHQHLAGLDDCSFDLELVANIPLERPSISIVGPLDGAIFTSGPVFLETATSDAAGGVTQVNFYTNGVFLDEVTSEPFSFAWQNPPVGRYTITARAFDDLHTCYGLTPVSF